MLSLVKPELALDK